MSIFHLNVVFRHLFLATIFLVFFVYFRDSWGNLIFVSVHFYNFQFIYSFGCRNSIISEDFMKRLDLKIFRKAIFSKSEILGFGIKYEMFKG